MFKKIHWRWYLPHAIVAATVYCIPVTIFLVNASYTQSWLLFLGNLLFLFVIVFFLFSFNKKRKDNAGSVTMLAAGIITTAIGTVVALVLCLLLMMLLIPGFFRPGIADKVMTNAPANIITGKTNGLVFEVVASAIVGNVSAGSFVSVLFPFALKGDQTSENVSKQQSKL